MSCNGCRVLRKGCSQKDCELRPCLQWIKSPQSQANATLFLAKFYGRAGLINLINAGPNHLRPDIFKSLLYEACGRIIDPIQGSVGLMSSGNWQRCQDGVEAVLQGSPLQERCDIRHLTKNSHHQLRTRCHGGKRSKTSASTPVDSVEYTTMMNESDAKFTITGWNYCEEDQKDQGLMSRTPSQDSFSVETVEAELFMSQPILGVKRELDYLSETELDLTLSLNSVMHKYTVVDISDGED